MSPEVAAGAARLVAKSGCASPSMVQRRLGLSFPDAMAVMRDLETYGVVGPADGLTREVLVPPDQAEVAELAVRMGYRYQRVSHAVVTREQRAAAEQVVVGVLPITMPDPVARHLARQVVNALVLAGWAPVR